VVDVEAEFALEGCLAAALAGVDVGEVEGGGQVRVGGGIPGLGVDAVEDADESPARKRRTWSRPKPKAGVWISRA
jgi:hypothetical protein